MDYSHFWEVHRQAGDTDYWQETLVKGIWYNMGLTLTEVQQINVTVIFICSSHSVVRKQIVPLVAMVTAAPLLSLVPP